MKKIRIFWIMACLLTVSTLAMAQRNHYVSKEIPVGRFTAISVDAGIDVDFYQTNNALPQVKLNAPSHAEELINIRVEGNTLRIGVKRRKSNFFHNKNLHFDDGKTRVSVYANDIRQINIQGSGDIHLRRGWKSRGDLHINVRGSGDIEGSSISCTALHINVSGSGDVNFKNVKSNLADVRIKGSGDVHLTGNTQSAKYAISGSGEIEAVRLKSLRTNVSVSGSGEVSCHASQFLRVDVRGMGKVSYRGKPTIEANNRSMRALRKL